MRIVLFLACFGLLSPLAAAQCIGGYCGRGVAVPVAPPMIYQPQTTWQPRTIMQPQKTWQPMQYQGSSFLERRYRTPLRNWWFGRGYTQHFYLPVRQ